MKTLKGKIFAVLLAVIVGVPIIAGLMGYKSPARLAASVDRSDACFMAQKFVRQNLKAPTTAEFPTWTEENCKATKSGDTWKVRSFVNAQNSYGAMIRSDYGVEMRYNPGSDNWTLLDIAIVSP